MLTAYLPEKPAVRGENINLKVNIKKIMNNNKSTSNIHTHTKYNLHLNYHIILLNEANI